MAEPKHPYQFLFEGVVDGNKRTPFNYTAKRDPSPSFILAPK
ncbi:hypothetical protein [Candidatus Protochlamydia amoebophila]|nr:hypothetical protein [Candidatus Protochlamydia amoebophila]